MMAEEGLGAEHVAKKNGRSIYYLSVVSVY
jgi:hypothetical protein